MHRRSVGGPRGLIDAADGRVYRRIEHGLRIFARRDENVAQCRDEAVERLFRLRFRRSIMMHSGTSSGK